MMALNTRDTSIVKDKDMDQAVSNTRMVQNTTELGRMDSLKDMGSSNTLMEIHILVIGLRTSLKVLASM